ncbi:BppU family phage baseplate upper protein [Clostridium perfringens]|nr:BppU family phage baseplate upper protein [Clostridium perfringens]
MNYSRSQRLKVDMLKNELLQTLIRFKQYDINTSILELEVVADGQAIQLSEGDEIFLGFKHENKLTMQQLKIIRYKNLQSCFNEEYKEVKLTYKNRETNIFNVVLDDELINSSGQFIGEIIIANKAEGARLTSQPFTFTVESSITPNNERG